MFWEKAIPPACRGLVGCFAFSLQDDELVCHHYYSPLASNAKSLPFCQRHSTGLAAALSYNGYLIRLPTLGLTAIGCWIRFGPTGQLPCTAMDTKRRCYGKKTARRTEAIVLSGELAKLSMTNTQHVADHRM